MQPVQIEDWRISHTAPVDDFSETIFFTGNGTLGVRGFGAWSRKPTPQAHAVFCAGLFSHIKPGITDMVQLPDLLTLRPAGEEPDGNVRQSLNLATGVLTQSWDTPHAACRMERAVSMADSQLILQRLTLTARQAQLFTVEALADSTVRNLPVHDDQSVVSTELVELLKLQSLTASQMVLATLSEGQPVELCWRLHSNLDCERAQTVDGGTARETLTRALIPGESWTLEKHVRILLSGETCHPDAAEPWAANADTWKALWRDCDLEVDSDDPELQGALRYNIFQLLTNNAAENRHVSIGARGLSHGRYKGNVFWDTEIFMLPFYLWTRPEAAKNLLLYRFDRLADAREVAKRQNLDGARFPWMCSVNGLEQCESWDIGLCEVHVTADVVYAIHRYEDVTGDAAFARNVAAPVYRDTARYWLTRLTYEPARDQYSSFFVKGPDEYCGATVNNTFTNYMARHNLRLALAEAELTPEERTRMVYAENRIPLLYDPKRDLYLQDETLNRLEDPPFLKNGDEPAYKQYSFDRMQRYRVLKQADLVLLMTMFPQAFTPAQQRNVFEEYEPITLHDSTLSYGVHAHLACRLGLWDKAETYLQKAVYLDLKNVMNNTGHEGLHMAALGAAWQAVVFGAVGLWSEDGKLTVNPMLPPSIRGIRLILKHRGQRWRLAVTRQGYTLREEA